MFNLVYSSLGGFQISAAQCSERSLLLPLIVVVVIVVVLELELVVGVVVVVMIMLAMMVFHSCSGVDGDFVIVLWLCLVDFLLGWMIGWLLACLDDGCLWLLLLFLLVSCVSSSSNPARITFVA